MSHEERMVNRFLKVKRRITPTTNIAIEVVNISISIILDKQEIKNLFNGLSSSKFPAKSNETNGSKRKNNNTEKSTANRLHTSTAKILGL
jgi:hypothetical protein